MPEDRPALIILRINALARTAAKHGRKLDPNLVLSVTNGRKV